MCFNGYHLLIILALFFGAETKKTGTRTIRRLSVDYASNPKYMHSYEVHILPDHIGMDMTMGFTQDMDERLWATVGIKTGNELETNVSKARPLIQFDFSVCDMMKQAIKSKHNILQMWTSNFLRRGSLPKQCPIKSGNYLWRDIRPQKATLPFVPNGKYRFICDLFFKQNNYRESISNMSMLIEIK